MKTKLSSSQSRGLLPAFVHAAILAVLLHGQCVGAPGTPVFPFPESCQALYSQDFDQNFTPDMTNCELWIPGLGMLEQSWSGFALQRAAEPVTPFIVPAQNADGTTNISSDSGGSLRWWLLPYWTSGVGNGTPATLLEMDAVSGLGTACAWSLQVSPDGSTVTLFNQTGAGAQPVLQAPIAWEAGTPHNVCLNFSPQSTSLYLDGAPAAQGRGVASVPPSVGQLVLGSSLSGANTAGADPSCAGATIHTGKPTCQWA
jgi:hypothetical protein